MDYDDFKIAKDRLKEVLNKNLEILKVSKYENIPDSINNSINYSEPKIKSMILKRMNFLNYNEQGGQPGTLLNKISTISINKYGEDITSMVNTEDNLYNSASGARFYKNGNDVYEVITSVNEIGQSVNNVNYFNYEDFIKNYTKSTNSDSLDNKGNNLPALKSDRISSPLQHYYLIKVSFRDTLIESNLSKISCIRKFENQSFFCSGPTGQGTIKYIENHYKYPNMNIPALELELNIKIGALDLETYGNDSNGLGLHSVVAGG